MNLAIGRGVRTGKYANLVEQGVIEPVSEVIRTIIHAVDSAIHQMQN